MKLKSDLLGSLSHEIAELVGSVSRSVVTIKGHSLSLSESSVGSGWVYGAEGYVVTNYHVIDGMREPLLLIDHCKNEHSCKVVGSDKCNDLALLIAPSLVSPVLSLDCDQPRVGSICLAIGSPLGRRESASMGIVSGLDRQERHPSGVLIEDMIQTDATINPGNSGGPLVGVDGRVVGVNTMGTGQNINFSVSAATVHHVVPELIEFGSIKRAALGVSVSENSVGVEAQGVSVMSCRDSDGSLRVGDVISRFNDREISKKVDLMRCLNRSAIGATAHLLVLRNGEQLSVELTPFEKS